MKKTYLELFCPENGDPNFSKCKYQTIYQTI